MLADEIETVNDALVAAARAAGGSKVVGPLLWPAMSPDAAQRKLLDCLNPDRQHRLTPEEAIFVMGLARDAGNFAPWMAWCKLAGFGYAPPVARVDEAAALRAQLAGLMVQLQSVMHRVGGV